MLCCNLKVSQKKQSGEEINQSQRYALGLKADLLHKLSTQTSNRNFHFFGGEKIEREKMIGRRP